MILDFPPDEVLIGIVSRSEMPPVSEFIHMCGRLALLRHSKAKFTATGDGIALTLTQSPDQNDITSAIDAFADFLGEEHWVGKPRARNGGSY